MFGWAKFWLAAGLTCRPRHPADGRFDRSSRRNTGDDVVCRPIDNGRAGHLPDDSALRQVASDGGTTPSSDRCSSGAESGGERLDRDFGIVRGGVSQASMAAWSPSEGYVSFRSRAVVNGTSGKNFGGGICGGASGGERALWGGRTFIRVRRRTEQGAEATADGPGFRVDSLGAAVVGRNLFWGGWGGVWAPFGVLTALGLVVLYLCFPTVSSPRSCSPGESWARRWRGGRRGGGDGGLVCDPPTAHWGGS